MGIPWQERRWSSLSALQGGYNDAVATAAELGSLMTLPDVDLSVSSALDAPAGDARSSRSAAASPSSRPPTPPAPGPPLPAPGPPPSWVGDLRKIPFVRLTQDGGKEEPWPEPDAQKSSKKVSAETARKNRKTAGTAATLKMHHLDKKTFDQHHLEFKASSLSAKCKFSERPKYDIQVKKPNVFDLDWLYSVPCGKKMEGRPVPVLDLLESP